MAETDTSLKIVKESGRAGPDSDGEAFLTGEVVTLSVGHGVHDTYTAFLPPLLPVLISEFSINLTGAGFLSVFLQAPSIFQPLIGHLADRFAMRYFVIAAPAITGTMMSMLGIAPSYTALAIFLLIAGFSSAGLHSVAPVMTGRVSGGSLGKGMGFFMVGGELGRTLGPILLVTALAYITLENLPWLMVGGWATSAMLFLRLRRIPGRNPDARSGLPWGAAVRSMRPLMLPLSGILIARSFMSASLTTYLPTLLTERGVNLWFAGAGLTLLEGAGVVGAIVGGSLSDRVGRRIILLVSMLGTPLFMLAFLVSGDIGQAILLPVMGFVSLSGAPVIMAWVQESYPKNRALANGIYMGMSFLIQAAVAVILGRIGDLAGLEQGMLLSAILMVMAIPLVFIMPRRRVAAGAA